MSARGTRLTIVLVTLVVAIVFILLAVLARFYYDDYGVPLSGLLSRLSETTWTILGVLAFIVAAIVLLMVALRPNLVFQVQELTPRTLKPQLHIRCRNCGTVSRLEDNGERPMQHFCAKCGQVGSYAGPESGEKGFIYTRIEMKLGCTRCNTTFRVPEPLVRPLFTECPNCHAKGVLRENQRPKDAQEIPLRCLQCGHGYHVYATRAHWASQFPCPSCGTVNPLPPPAGGMPA